MQEGAPRPGQQISKFSEYRGKYGQTTVLSGQAKSSCAKTKARLHSPEEP